MNWEQAQDARFKKRQHETKEWWKRRAPFFILAFIVMGALAFWLG